MREKLYAWIALSRPPFHSVGLLPFILGGVQAWRELGVFRWAVFFWGSLGVVFVMLATYYAGEYWDYVEDSLSARLGTSRFAGGSQVLQRGLLPRHTALWASLTCLVLAAAVALVLQIGYGTGPLTIPFSVLGMLGGFFYSAKPIRWVSRGWGEMWIAFCYGWLPVAVGYYLQTSKLVELVHWLAFPVGLTILNVILLNEFPDYPADLAAGKANLVVRLGRVRASRLYAMVSFASWVTMFISLQHGVPLRALWFYFPVLILSMILVVQMLHGAWRSRVSLERLCAANLLVNLGTTTACIFAFTG